MLVQSKDPANGTVDNYGSYLNYAPDDGFSGEESMSYTIEDSTGLQADRHGDGVGRHRDGFVGAT